MPGTLGYQRHMDIESLFAQQAALADAHYQNAVRYERHAADERRKGDIEAAKLEGMKSLLAAMSAPSKTQPGELRSPVVERRAGGRQPGAITRQWQEVLKRLYGHGRLHYEVFHATYAEVADAPITLSGVRDRVRKLVGMGWVSGDTSSGFEVTEAAASRYGFKMNEGPAEAGPSGGDVAERFNAPASEAGGVGPGKSAPVGSNPTVSAPLFQSVSSEIDLA